MPGFKLSAKATETVEYLEAVLKLADHYTALVEQFAAAKTKNSDMYASQLARELSQLRQKAMMKNLGFIADTAGQLGVMASRGGSPMMKGRMLRDGVAAFRSLVERTIKGTIVADENEQKEKAHLAEKAKQAEIEHVRARVLAEEAREAERKGAAAAAGTKSAGPAPAAPRAGAPAPAASPAKPGAPAAKPAAGAKPAPGAPGAPPAPAPAPGSAAGPGGGSTPTPSRG